jgi:hypothetical protein
MTLFISSVASGSDKREAGAKNRFRVIARSPESSGS